MVYDNQPVNGSEGMTETPSLNNSDVPEMQPFAIDVAWLMADLKCEDIALFDVRGLSQVTDFMIIASGTSNRQMMTVARDILEFGESLGHTAFRTNKERSSSWVVIDFVELTVHVFEPATRSFYDLEHLWLDAKRISWREFADKRTQYIRTPSGPRNEIRRVESPERYSEDSQVEANQEDFEH